MALKPKVLFGKVMHARLFPKKNRFLYRIFYLSLPLSKLDALPLAHNRFAPLSFYDADHGASDGSDLEQWARGILEDYGLEKADGEIVLACMPRVFGYVFNPVSFWLCYDKHEQLRAVLCEVNNTFGERHIYICAHSDSRPISATDSLLAEKVFHVSPMLKREGFYEFTFDFTDNNLNVWIDYYNADLKKQLVTSLAGEQHEMDAASIRKACWLYPLITFKAIALIHWQAFKLLSRGITYMEKPNQLDTRISRTKQLSKQ